MLIKLIFTLPYLSVSVCLSICLSVYLSICLYIYLSIYLFYSTDYHRYFWVGVYPQSIQTLTVFQTRKAAKFCTLHQINLTVKTIKSKHYRPAIFTESYTFSKKIRIMYALFRTKLSNQVEYSQPLFPESANTC